MQTRNLLVFATAALVATAPGAADARTARRHAPAPVNERSVSPAASVLAANAAAIREPAPGSYLNAVQVYTFVDGAIYRLFTAPDKVSDIVLQPAEQLIAISAGDTARWVIGDTISGSEGTRQVHILVKPFTSGLRTNLVVTTSRRTYHLELESTPRTAMAAISWRYPQDEAIKPVEVPHLPEGKTVMLSGVSPENLNFGYRIRGAGVAWKPVRAFDDGRKTYIEFPSALGQTDLPPLYVLSDSGAAELTNYRLAGRYYVLDRLFRSAELRAGAKRQTVVRISRLGADHE